MAAKYEGYIWVPTKGWKKVVGTTSLEKAIRVLGEFIPLEVYLTEYDAKLGRVRCWVDGYAHTILDTAIPLGQISRLAADNDIVI